MRKEFNLVLPGPGPSFNERSFVPFNSFLNNLKRAYRKKNVLISDIYFETDGSSTFLILPLFFRSRFSSKIRRFFLRQTRSVVSKRTRKFNPFSIFAHLGNQFFISNKVLNKQLNVPRLTTLYQQFSFFERSLFSRRFNVFLDFIKVVCLFKQRIIGVPVFAEILGEIFKFIQKGSHSRYVFFIKYLFSTLCDNKAESGFLGMRLFISGKLSGKPRSSCVKVIKGCVPLKTFDSFVKHHSLSIQTGYGTFGLKVWVNYSTNKSKQVFL